MPDTSPPPEIAFIESKSPDFGRISSLLDSCRDSNHWANRGPLYTQLARDYFAWLHLAADSAVVPCANGGVGLEAMARLLALRAGRRLRWVGSAFSFANLGRGYFAGMTFLDCDGRDVEAMYTTALPQEKKAFLTGLIG